MATVPNRVEAEAAMLAHMRSSDSFTFRQLFMHADTALNAEAGTYYRLADGLIQKHRRLGNIDQTAKRGEWRWIAESVS